MLSQVKFLDVALLRLINVEWAHPALDAVLSAIADFGMLKWPFAAVLIGLLIFGRFKERVFLAMLIPVFLIGDAGINGTIKRAVNRPRPHEAVSHIRKVERHLGQCRARASEVKTPTHGNSMTSGHVCNNVAAALLLTLLYGRWGALAWLWAFSIGYSRIYTGDHYPSDVFVSAIVALAYTGLFCWAASWLWTRAGPRLFPQTHAAHPKLFN